MPLPDLGTNLFKTRMASLELIEEAARKNLTLVGPQTDTLADKFPGIVDRPDEQAAIRLCRACNPKPRVYTCPLCDWETEDQWRMRLHNDINPPRCQQRAAKKERAWSSKVGLDRG